MVYRLAEPQSLYFLLVAMPAIVLAWVFMSRKRKQLAKVFGSKVYTFLSANVSWKKRKLKLTLQGLFLLFAVIALARPQSGQALQDIKSEGVELIFLFDVSKSMLAEDVKPSRLEFAKKEVKRFLDLGGGDKIGLVAFAGSSVLMSPLTTDKSAVKMYIDSLGPNVVSTQGTNFAEGLGEVKKALIRGGQEERSGSVVTKAVVVISDGEDNEKGAYQTAEQLKEEGINIFTLAVGTAKGGAIPRRDRSGNLRGYEKDKKNKVILTQTKGESLKKLAEIGGGSFHHVTFGGSAIEQLKEDVSRLEQTEFESAELREYDEKYQIILFLALMLAFVELALGEKQILGRVWKGRFEVSPS